MVIYHPKTEAEREQLLKVPGVTPAEDGELLFPATAVPRLLNDLQLPETAWRRLGPTLKPGAVQEALKRGAQSPKIPR